jgi:hypothetical protein
VPERVPFGVHLPTFEQVMFEAVVLLNDVAAFEVLQVLGKRAAKALQSARELVYDLSYTLAAKKIHDSTIRERFFIFN